MNADSADSRGSQLRRDRGPGSADERRRIAGRYYTPSRIAKEIVESCLRGMGAGTPGSSPARILDPACGDGAFLVEAFDLLAASDGDAAWMANDNWRRRLELVRDSLFGVDSDGAAILKLRERLAEKIGAPIDSADDVQSVLIANFRIGDALTGPDWSPPTSDGESSDGAGEGNGLDWRAAFPLVAASGGFDIVVGNPPYRRERDTRDAFAAIARSPLGRRWRRPRMDLWHYFVHRGLDLLRPGGRLAFIVNGYWTSATSAAPLIERLARETTVEEIRLLGDERVFDDVTGRHMVFRLRKAAGGGPCVLHDGGEPYEREQSELFRHGRLIVTRADPAVEAMAARCALGDEFDVRQGIAENPPRITPRLLERLPGPYTAGEGVFVLSAEERARLALSPEEESLLRPYFAQNRIAPFELAEPADEFLLYLTKRTAPDLDAFPNVRRHLERFRPILERRREVERGRIAWWHLHWPREQRIFLEPRILGPQMGRRPAFALVERPAFVGFAVNVIVAKRHWETRDDDGLSLAALCGLLNSESAARWFATFAKRRGANLDVGGMLLRTFPLPRRDAALERQLESLVERRRTMPRKRPDQASECEPIDREINAIARSLLGSVLPDEAP